MSSDRLIPVYKRYDSTTAYVSISDSDRHPDLHYAATIHHGIDLDDFAIDPSPGEDLLFFGRVNLQSVGRPDAAATVAAPIASVATTWDDLVFVGDLSLITPSGNRPTAHFSQAQRIGRFRRTRSHLRPAGSRAAT